jgi:hypothetical protein
MTAIAYRVERSRFCLAVPGMMTRAIDGTRGNGDGTRGNVGSTGGNLGSGETVGSTGGNVGSTEGSRVSVIGGNSPGIPPAWSKPPIWACFRLSWHDG